MLTRMLEAQTLYTFKSYELDSNYLSRHASAEHDVRAAK